MEGEGRSGPGPLVARALELPDWIAENEGIEDLIASDLSAFHRIDDPDDIAVARYLNLAVLLPAYDGACRLAAIAERQAAEHRAPMAVGMGAPATGAPYAPVNPDAHHHDPTVPPATSNDVASLAAMSQQSGFPGIEYSGG